MNAILEILGILIFGIASIIYRIFALSKMWDLAMVPMGAPHLGMLKTYGIACVLYAFVNAYNTNNLKKDESSTIKKILTEVAGISVTWLIVYYIFR